MSRENLIFLYYSFFILLVVCAGNKGKIRGLKKIGQFFLAFLFYLSFVFGFHLFLIVCLKTAKSDLFGKNIPFYTLMTAFGKMWHNAVIPINKGKVEILALLHQLLLCQY